MSDRVALIRAICDQPKEDTPRLVYADWCGENDDPETLEFIRGQIEQDRLQAIRIINEDGEICGWKRKKDRDRSATLSRRESALLARNRERWSRWPCPACSWKGGGTCLACNKTRDLFKYILEGRGGGVEQKMEVHFRRGFPAIVEVPDMGWVCRRTGTLLESPVGDEYQPTPWLRAVARHTTIEEVWVMDRVPADRVTVNGRYYWFKQEHPVLSLTAESFPQAMIPAPVFEVMAKNKNTIGLPFDSPDAARSALGRSWIEWGHERVKEED